MKKEEEEQEEEEEERGRMPNHDNFTSRAVKLRYIAMLYILSFDWKLAVEHDVKCVVVYLAARYSSVCNVLRQWSIWLIPTYRVYQFYDGVYQLYDSYTPSGCNELNITL